MKPEDVTTGVHDAGAFQVIVSRCVFEETAAENAKFFEVLLHEKKDGLIFYVNLAQDVRFAWFAWMQSFEHSMQDEDMVEFNSHVWSVFVKIGMPTYKLSRRSIARLHEICTKLSKKRK